MPVDRVNSLSHMPHRRESLAATVRGSSGTSSATEPLAVPSPKDFAQSASAAGNSSTELVGNTLVNHRVSGDLCYRKQVLALEGFVFTLGPAGRQR